MANEDASPAHFVPTYLKLNIIHSNNVQIGLHMLQNMI